MGVTGLWQIVQPCARPIKIETLNRKRLAIDASIWIYQFLKAVRDKEGNALRNSHVVGFFRRICKLLFFGIKPVFVFDGGAPALKRQTISARKSRREGRREDAVRTAGKLLAVQMQRRAEEEELKRKADAGRERQEDEEDVPDEALVYVEELHMTPKERQQNRQFRKKDAYHLPELEVSLSEMGGSDDPRIMSLEELEAYARQFDTGEDINVYDFSKIDYDSPFFMSLPASDRYNILNAARLRSRLRMGHSKEQLDRMFPDRMAFSKFQIERVRERNELTQRLMHLNGFDDGADFGSGRVAGEKGREYVLVKNDGVEGGWALGVISDEGKQEKPIDVDKPVHAGKKEADEDWENEDDFEDIPIEGLNRLPKPKSINARINDDLMEQRRSLYSARKPATKGKQKSTSVAHESNSLFVQESDVDEGEWEDVDASGKTLAEGDVSAEEDNELKRAIAMSLENDESSHSRPEFPRRQQNAPQAPAQDDALPVFHQSTLKEQVPIPGGSGRAIANAVNKRAFNAATDNQEKNVTFSVSDKDESGDEDSMDLQAMLAQSRNTEARKAAGNKLQPPRAPKPANQVAKEAGFSGPLPFEKLDLGSSLLGKKKMQQRAEAAAGGFENPELTPRSPKKAHPLPPWFSGKLEDGMKAQDAIENKDREKAKEYSEQLRIEGRDANNIQRLTTANVIDVEENNSSLQNPEVLDFEARETGFCKAVRPSIGESNTRNDGALGESPAPERKSVIEQREEVPPFSKNEANPVTAANGHSMAPAEAKLAPPFQSSKSGDEDGSIQWSDSGDEVPQNGNSTISSGQPYNPQRTGQISENLSPSQSVDFEDVDIPDVSLIQEASGPAKGYEQFESAELSLDLDEPDSVSAPDEFDDFSDPEEEEMLRALTLEAEEHARFASSFNNKSHAQNIQEFDRELKQLRNQQKKDRRDADEVTHIMITECQHLLRLFGLPYVTAPMEAEAQCAELVRLGLVDGIVTDDSDCFLFGGTRVYKNMFNQAKFVECYLTSDLEKEFDLNREKLISIAHLLGSDYTEGLPGVGPVTALEILSEFQSLDEFKAWWSAVQMNQIPKSEDADKPFRRKFRRNTTKLFLPTTFPDARVDIAYNSPEVDSDPQAFLWGVPDLDALRSFLMATIGWSQERTDEVLVPVIKDMNRRLDEGTQADITAFFDGSVGLGASATLKGSTREGFAPRKRGTASKRMSSALDRMAQQARVKKTPRRSEIQRQDEAAEDVSNTEFQPAVASNEARKRKTDDRTYRDEADFDPEEERSPTVSKESRKKAKKPKKSATTPTGKRKKLADVE